MSFGCWGANPDVKQFMTQRNMTLTDLNNYYMSRLLAMVVGNTSSGTPDLKGVPSSIMGKTDVLVWRPGAADHGVDLPKNLIFDVCVSEIKSEYTAAATRVRK